MTSNSTTPSTYQSLLTTELPQTAALSGLTTGPITAAASIPAPVLAITLGNNTYATIAAKAIAPNLTISSQTDPNTTITGARVTINDGFNTSQDVLSIAGQTGANGTITGLTWAYNSTTGILSLDGTAAIGVYQAALQQVTYFNSSQNPSAADRKIDFSLGKNPVNSVNGHFYQFVAASGIKWNDAYTAANASINEFGLHGYLATITSASEQSFVAAKVQGNGWIGASDATTITNPASGLAAQWTWVDGPEQGQVFWNGLATNLGGSAVTNQYSNWSTGEPNNYNPATQAQGANSGGSERYAHIIGANIQGTVLYAWNDLPNDVTAVYGAGSPFIPNGYVIEYGGLATDPVIQISASVTVYVPSNNNLRQLDFTGDGKADIFWRNQTTGDNALWAMNGFTSTSQQVINNVPLNWRVEAIADFDGNKKGDVLWRDYNTGTVAIWQMNNTAIATTAIFDVPLNWKVVGTGDFNGDGQDDILWRNYTDGATGVWLINGTQRIGVLTLGSPPLEWQVSSVGDFDGNGKADILWHNDATSQNAIWLLNGAAPPLNQQLIGSTPGGWFAPGTGLFDAGNNRSDILWRNATSGLTAIWLQNGLVPTQSEVLLGAIPLDWRVVGLGDFNGDGRTELLWRSYSSGQNGIWTINGVTSPVQGLISDPVPLSWEVV